MERILLREVSYGYCISSMSFQFEKYPNWSGIPTFLCSLIYCVISVWVSAVYAKYVSTPIHPVEFPQKNQFPKKQGFPLSTLIILDWYLKLLILHLFRDLLWNIGLSVSGLRKVRFNAYTPSQISTKTQFPKKPGFPLSALIILDWYPYVSLFPDLLWNIGLSVSGLRKIRFNAYTPRRISTKKSVPKETRIPIVHVNNFRLVSKIINFRFVPWFIVKYRFECQRFTKNTFQRLHTPSNFHKKNQFPKKQGFPLAALIILDWYPYVSLFPDLLCNIDLSVSGLRKIRFNAYTPRRISTKKISSQRNKDSHCPR